MEDGGTEGPSATRGGGQAAISLMPDVDGTYVRIFESLQLKGLYIGSHCMRQCRSQEIMDHEGHHIIPRSLVVLFLIGNGWLLKSVQCGSDSHD